MHDSKDTDELTTKQSAKDTWPSDVTQLRRSDKTKKNLIVINLIHKMLL